VNTAEDESDKEISHVATGMYSYMCMIRYSDKCEERQVREERQMEESEKALLASMKAGNHAAA
jgi:hypothetical protein